MSRVRIYELAKDLNMDSNEIVEKLQGAGFPVNNSLSSLDNDDLARAKDCLFGVKNEILEEKRIKPTVIRRRKKVLANKPEEHIQEETEKEEKPEPVIEKIAEKELPRIEEETEETPKKEDEDVLQQEEPTSEELLETKSREIKGKPKKKKKEKPKFTPARIVKKAPVQPEEPNIEVPVEKKIEPADISSLAEAFQKGEEKKKKKKDSKELTSHKDFSRRRREVFERVDLYGDVETGFSGKKKFKKKDKFEKKKFSHTEITTPKAIKRRIKVPDVVTAGELAKKMGVKSSALMKKLLELDVQLGINDPIDFDAASLIANDFEYELEHASLGEEEILSEDTTDKEEDLKPRPPVITIMGHVDHGKTSLLDYIRKSKVIENEAGGITQHIGAYFVKTSRGNIVFLDTPGHEAFTAMRSRGAKVTDLIVLVVAADDGVKDQTVEAINHAKAAGVPIIVAVNKIDKPATDTDKVTRELAKYDVLVENWGGETLLAAVSAKTGQGVEELLDSIILQAELLELKANYKKRARGIVIEARLDKSRGPVMTVLIRDGALHAGDFFVCGKNVGKVRAMFNDRGKKIKEAFPSMPVEIYGISDVPRAGDDFIVLSSEKKAKLIAENRRDKSQPGMLTKKDSVSLDNLFEKIREGETKELNIIVKADVQGSLEALVDSLVKQSTKEVKLKVIHGATGAVTESDVMLANASNAIIICFNLRVNPAVQEIAKKESVDIKSYNVIYKVIEDIRLAMTGLLEPVYTENVIGHVDIKEIFHVSKVGTIAGCYVSDGKIERDANVRLLRDDAVIFNGKISSLKRFKDDAKDVSAGLECGVGLQNYNDMKPGDILEIYKLEEEKAEL
ncbi:MAG: translation initiation factor IF-2 [Deltaproteobacteria bacterium]|nr:translation initiation factor IF-2 [Deltaproteobacteria bacterium]